MNSNYKHLHDSYKQWLNILNYAPKTQYSYGLHVAAFLSWLTENKVPQLTHLRKDHSKQYRRYLQTRENQQYGGCLNHYTINKELKAVNNLMKYLSYQQTGNIYLLHFQMQEVASRKTVLTEEEIRQLYQATEVEECHSRDYYQAQRDRAMLGIYYGCGLRHNEGIQLNSSDIDVLEEVVHVRKGKGGKSRIVPIASQCLEDLETYIREGRRFYLKGTEEEALFLNHQGTRLQSSGMYYRLNQLKEKAGLAQRFSFHSLRHSIATHLLSHGMDLEKIKDFLGHSSLESTQIYTHILHDETGDTTTTPANVLPSSGNKRLYRQNHSRYMSEPQTYPNMV